MIGAVAKGGLSQTKATTVDGRPMKGEFRRIARADDTAAERPGLVTSEATSVAHEVGTEDNLGGQAHVPGAANAGKKVLVVDDDPDVRAVAVALLEDLGYEVVDVGDGYAGLAVLKSDPAIALLFTDWVMPGMDGRQLAARAAELRPKLPVLVASGNVNRFLAGWRATANVRFLAKPYRRHDLADALHAALSGRRSGNDG